MGDLLWPAYDGPGDLAAIEAVPLADRGLPGTTYELARPGRRAVAGPGRPVRAAGRDGGSSRRSGPSPSCSPTSIATPTCSTPRRAPHRRRSPCSPRTATSSSPRRWPPSSPGSPRRSTAACPASTSPSCCAGRAPGSWSPPAPTSRPRSGTARGSLAVEAGIEALLALGPTGADAAEAELLPIDGVRVGHLSALAAGAATRPPSWASRPRPPTSPPSSTPVARRARRSSQRTPTPTRSATPG